MNKAEQLIACLEGEIAKRDARIAELESKTVRGFLIIDGMAFNPTEILSQNSDLCAALDERDQLRAELAAIKAQEPVEYQLRALIRDVTNIPEAGYYMPQSWHDQVIALSLSGKLDAPVSEAKAQEEGK